MAAGLLIAFVVVPLVEIYVIVQVGEVIGALPTVALLLGVSVLGAVVVRREGVRAWRRLREALAEHRVPGREVVDGALVLAGGALLLAPGFVTDAVGFLLVLPPTRPLFRRLLLAMPARRLRRRAPRRPRKTVIEGQVVGERSDPAAAGPEDHKPPGSAGGRAGGSW